MFKITKMKTEGLSIVMSCLLHWYYDKIILTKSSRTT
jgi:hypothetical protein